MPLLRLLISERSGIRLIISPSVLRSTRMCLASSVSVRDSLLGECEEDAELPRGNLVLRRQLLTEGVDACIQKTHQKTETFVEFQPTGDVFR